MKRLLNQPFLQRSIGLHIDDGTWSKYLYQYGLTSSGSEIPHNDPSTMSNPDDTLSLIDFNGVTSFDNLFGDPSSNSVYGSFFNAKRIGIFHYCVIADKYSNNDQVYGFNNVPEDEEQNPLGLDYPKDSFALLEGAIDDSDYSGDKSKFVAKVIMHELGRNFGLEVPMDRRGMTPTYVDTAMYYGWEKIVIDFADGNPNSQPEPNEWNVVKNNMAASIDHPEKGLY